MKVAEHLRRMTGQEVKVAKSKTVFVNIGFGYYHLNAGQCIHIQNCRQDFFLTCHSHTIECSASLPVELV